MSLFGVALIRYLDVEGLGHYDESGIGGDLFYATMPDLPDRAVMVMPTSGLTDIASGTLPYDRPTCQLMVRGERYQPIDGERRAWELYDHLNGLHRVVLDPGGMDEIYVVGIKAPVPPVHVRTDSKGRDRWSLNLEAMVKRPTARRPT